VLAPPLKDQRQVAHFTEGARVRRQYGGRASPLTRGRTYLPPPDAQSGGVRRRASTSQPGCLVAPEHVAVSRVPPNARCGKLRPEDPGGLRALAAQREAVDQQPKALAAQREAVDQQLAPATRLGVVNRSSVSCR